MVVLVFVIALLVKRIPQGSGFSWHVTTYYGVLPELKCRHYHRSSTTLSGVQLSSFVNKTMCNSETGIELCNAPDDTMEREEAAGLLSK